MIMTGRSETAMDD